MRASATATRGIAEAATGMEKWFKRGLLPLSSSVQENKLSYFKASNMMAIKSNSKSTNAKKAPLTMVAVVHEVLEAAWHLALGGFWKGFGKGLDDYICQEEAQDEVVNVQT
jgi:hypothetical protein